MVTVLRELGQAHSTLGAQFEKLTADVVTAKNEANQNSRCLSTLRGHFTRLAEELDFSK